jgi:hypothetical protein
MRVQHGGCHCGRVAFEVRGEPTSVLRCNCSICEMRGRYLHWIVPREDFTLTSRWVELALYSFGTHAAKHFFCRHCGITSFYVPRSHPGSMSINARCVRDLDVDALEVADFDGQNWELAFEKL